MLEPKRHVGDTNVEIVPMVNPSFQPTMVLFLTFFFFQFSVILSTLVVDLGSSIHVGTKAAAWLIWNVVLHRMLHLTLTNKLRMKPTRKLYLCGIVCHSCYVYYQLINKHINKFVSKQFKMSKCFANGMCDIPIIPGCLLLLCRLSVANGNPIYHVWCTSLLWRNTNHVLWIGVRRTLVSWVNCMGI